MLAKSCPLLWRLLHRTREPRRTHPNLNRPMSDCVYYESATHDHVHTLTFTAG